MESTNCFVCNSVYSKIIPLNCNHHICSKCFFKLCAFNLNSLFSSLKMNAEVPLKCVICEQKTQMPKQTIYDILKENNEDEDKNTPICEHHDKPIQFLCVQCNMKMCVECFDKHQSFSKIFALHKIIDYEESLQLGNFNTNCREHLTKPYEYKCLTCKTPICENCKTLHHFYHDVEKIKNDQNEIRPNIRIPFKSVDEVRQKIKEEENKSLDTIRMETIKFVDQIQVIINSFEILKTNILNKNNNLEDDIKRNYDMKNIIYSTFCFFINNIPKGDHFTLNWLEKFPKFFHNNYEFEYFFDKNIKNEIENINNKLNNILPSPDFITIKNKLKEINFECVKSITDINTYIHCLLQLNDGRLVAGAGDNTIKIFDPEDDFKCTGTLTGHTAPVYRLLQLNDGRLVAGAGDNTIKIFDPEDDFKCTGTLTGHTAPVYGLLQLNDRTLASGSLDKTIKIWYNSSCIKTLNGHEGFVACLIKLKLTNNKMASSSGDGSIKIWDTEDDYKCIQTLIGHTLVVFSLIQLRDGNLASASSDMSICIWDLKKSFNCLKIIKGHTKGVYCLFQSIDGNLISGSLDKSIKIWDTENNFTYLNTLSGHDNIIYCLTQLRDGKLISGSLDNTIRVWN